jgi:HAD superfamily phosphoserine phosphatase-like hydrolase
VITALALALAAIPPKTCPLEDKKMSKAAEIPRGRWSPENHGRIQALIREHGAGGPRWDPCDPPLAVFDWDNTIIAGDIGDQAFNVFAERGLFKFEEAVLAPLREETQQELRELWKGEDAAALRARLHRAYLELCEDKGNAVCYPWLTELFHGYARDWLERFAHELIEQELGREMGAQTVPGTEVVIQRGVRVRPEMEAAIRALDGAGFEVWVVSASPEWLIQVFAPRVGIPRERVLGMQPVFDAKSVAQPKIEPPVTYRSGKVAAIRSRIPRGGRRPAIAFGDAETDREMLEDAHLGVLFDRGIPGMRDRAEVLRWVLQPPFESAPSPTPRR